MKSLLFTAAYSTLCKLKIMPYNKLTSCLKIGIPLANVCLIQNRKKSTMVVGKRLRSQYHLILLLCVLIITEDDASRIGID